MEKNLKKISKDIQHYLPLFGIIVSGFIAFTLFSYDKLFQVTILVAVSISYVVWGIIHHAIHKDLYLSVIIEYIVISILGLVIVSSLVFRA